MTYRNLLWLAVAVLVIGGCCCPPPCAPRCASPCAPRVVCGPSVGTVTPMPPPGVKPSGFLPDYARLRPTPDREGSYIWMKPGLDLRVYDHVMFDEIQVILDDVAAAKVDDALRAKAATAFREILFEVIDPYYTVVEEPAEHVLRVKLALTDLVPTEAAEGEATSVRPGGAELEGILVDAKTGEQLVLLVSRIDDSARGDVASDEWKAVEGAFHEWADGLLTFLDSYKE